MGLVIHIDLIDLVGLVIAGVIAIVYCVLLLYTNFNKRIE